MSLPTYVFVLLIFLGGIVTAVLPSESTAQSRAFECGSSKEISESEGAALLERVQRTYASLSVLHGQFEQDSYLAALDTSESSSGEMWFEKPGKMRWVYKTPKSQIVIIRDGTLWLYQIDKKQVMIDDIGEVLLSDLPVAFLMGIGNLSRDFTFTKACRSKDGVVLSLVPKSKGDGDDSARNELQGFDLLIDEGQSLPKGARVTSVGGNMTAIVFRNVSTKETAPDASRFVLTYPNGVDVMDRRQGNTAD